MSKFTKGEQVAQVITPIRGEVAGFQVDQETGALQVLVKWIDADGGEHARYFNETDIEAVTS